MLKRQSLPPGLLWGPFLESPETFRAHFGWHSSLCIFKAKKSRSTKLCTYFNFYFLYNIWKDQLYRMSGSQLYEWFFGPEKSSGLSRNGPLARVAQGMVAQTRVHYRKKKVQVVIFHNQWLALTMLRATGLNWNSRILCCVFLTKCPTCLWPLFYYSFILWRSNPLSFLPSTINYTYQGSLYPPRHHPQLFVNSMIWRHSGKTWIKVNQTQNCVNPDFWPYSIFMSPTQAQNYVNSDFRLYNIFKSSITRRIHANYALIVNYHKQKKISATTVSMGGNYL